MPVLLVVDDEPAILHAFRRVFREPDVQLLTAERAAEGIATIREHPVTHILMPSNRELIEHWTINESRNLLFNEGRMGPDDRKIEFRYCLYLYDLAALKSLLDRAGMIVEEYWEDFYGEPYDDDDSDRLVCLARKT